MKLKLTLGIIGGMLLTLLNSNSIDAQTANFGTNRQPRTCTARTAPAKGRISAKQAALYVACDYESGPTAKYVSASRRYFIDIISLQVAPKPRAVNSQDMGIAVNVDTSQPAYDLKGSVVGYLCYNTTPGVIYKEGSNCTIWRSPESRGTCVKTTFGEWYCSMGVSVDREERHMPPPN